MDYTNIPELYESMQKELHTLTDEYFSALAARVGTDIEGNRAQVKKYKKVCEKINGINKAAHKKKVLRGWLISLAVCAGAALAAGIILACCGLAVSGAACIFAGMAVFAFSIAYIFAYLDPKIKGIEELSLKYTAATQKLKEEAFCQMAPLNRLLSDVNVVPFIERVWPDIRFCERFSKKAQNKMASMGFILNEDENTSCENTLSGTFLGNPFLYVRQLTLLIGEETYTGSEEISWTVEKRDSEGKMYTETEYASVTASITKPCPIYREKTTLYLCSKAAPTLSFLRAHSHFEKLTDKQVKKKRREMIKEAKKALKGKGKKSAKAEGFDTSDFSLFFEATNISDSKAFDEMFTRDVQDKLLALIKCPNGYGDDVSLFKRNCCVMIVSEHSGSWDLETRPNKCRFFAYDVARENFLSFCQNILKNIFFDLSPLMCIPAFLVPEKIDDSLEEFRGENFTYLEHEVMANRMKKSFRPENTKTDIILKTKGIKSEPGYDIVKVTASSFTAEDYTDIVCEWGPDGCWHDIPVVWTNFEPVEKEWQMQLFLYSSDYMEEGTDVSFEPREKDEKDKVTYHGITAKIQ